MILRPIGRPFLFALARRSAPTLCLHSHTKGSLKQGPILRVKAIETTLPSGGVGGGFSVSRHLLSTLFTSFVTSEMSTLLSLFKS